MMPEGCLPVSASGRSASGDHGMMSRLACGMELLFFGEPLDDLPANANETWSWEIATEPVALQKPPVKHTKGLAQFRRLSCRSDDVFVCSYPRCGLSWAHALAFHLCRSDEDGSLPYDATRVVGGRGPVLPDTPPTRWSLSDVERQDAPRVFSSHAAVADLPASFASSGARLIVVDRDPRDALVSAFFRLKRLGAKFRALECHDGRLGLAATACEGLTLEKVFDDFNDDGAGKASLALDFDAARARADPPEPRPLSSTYGDAVDRSGVDGAAALVNAAFSGDDVGDGGSARVGSSPGDYGDYYSWHAAHSRRAVDLGEDRVLHVHYERLQDEPEAVARDIYAFLYPTESSPSRAKVDEAVHFASFAVTAARGDDALRKGVTGDHKIYLSKEHWDALAVKCAKRLALEDRCAYQVARLTQDCPAALRAVPGPRRAAIIQAQNDAPADNVVVGRDWALSEKDVLFDGAGSPKEGKRKGSRVSKALASVRRSMTPGK